MCGFCAVFGVKEKVALLHSSLEKLNHRGPDAWRIDYDSNIKNCCLSFHRLAIIDYLDGMQPLRLHALPHLTLVCNGEIYNYKKLTEQFGFKYESRSDVEIILHLYAKFGVEEAARQLDGVFAFCIVDWLNKKVAMARDPFGVRPMFRLRERNGTLAVSSEAKGLIDFMKNDSSSDWEFDPFPPSHFEEYELDAEHGTTKLIRSVQYYKIGDAPRHGAPIQDSLTDDVHANIRSLLTEAVSKRLMSVRRIGCLLSGGLDSSLVSAMLVKLAKEQNLPYKIQTFSVGMGDTSPDILAARKVAAHIGSEHHEVTFSEQDVKDVLDKVLYHLETADITTVRASIGMFMVAKYIKEKTDSTVIYSGEGADEVAQGYIYFRDAPSAVEGHEESMRLLRDLYMYDVLRTDRTTAAHSLEVRVPFLDQKFTQYYLSLPIEARQPQNGVEKYLLRKSFDGTGLLPDDILWRHKEAFSDGVASKKKSLFEVLQEITEPLVSDEKLKNAALTFPHCTPKTKEAYYYREVFEKRFPSKSHWMPYFWMPRWSTATDPSARFISHYAAT